MKKMQTPLIKKFEKYNFQLKHLLVLFVILVSFLVLVSFVQKVSLQDLLLKTQNWYQRDSAERMANLTATSLELLLETNRHIKEFNDVEKENIIQAFNIILSQQKLQQNVADVSILVSNGQNFFAIDNGKVLYDYFFGKSLSNLPGMAVYDRAIDLYKTELARKMADNEQIYSIPEDEQVFHVFVPFVPKGEYVGAVYVKNTPDFSFITREIIASYDKTAL